MPRTPLTRRLAALATGVALAVGLVAVPATAATAAAPATALNTATVDTYYADTAYRLGYSNFNVTAGSLPAGLSVGNALGLISGTPIFDPSLEATQTYSFTVTSKPIIGSANAKDYTITLNLPAPKWSGHITLADGAVGEAYEATFLPAKRAASYWAEGLPAGLSMDPTSGTISGTPEYDATYGNSKTFDVTIWASNNADSTATYTELTITTAAPVIETTVLPDGWMNVAYSEQIVATGPGLEYGIIDGELPEGLTLDMETGIISGTSLAYGDFAFTIAAANTAGEDSVALNLLMQEPAIIETEVLPDAVLHADYAAQIYASGPDVTFGITDGDLPLGLNLNPETGEIIGSSTETGVVSLDITATNPAGSDTRTYTIETFAAPVILNDELPGGVVGSWYYGEIYTDEHATLFEIVDGAIPTGLSFDADFGILYGPNTAAGTFTFSVKASNIAGSDIREYTVTVTESAVTLSTGSVAPGGTVVVKGTGFFPGDEGTIWLHSEPVKIGTYVTDENGAFSVTVTIPADTTLGAHRIEVRSEWTGSIYTNLAVAAAKPAGGIATAGAEVVPAGIAGALLLLIGGAGVFLARRRHAEVK